MRRVVPLLLAVMLSGCASAPLKAPPAKTPNEPGTLLEVSPLEHMSSIGNRFMLWFGGVRGGSFPCSVDSYRVRYVSIDPRGKPIAVSGMFAVPRGNGAPLGLVSYQHGTSTERDEAPSRLTAEGRMVARVFGGLCYTLFAPD